jgi:hypothetical protein
MGWYLDFYFLLCSVLYKTPQHRLSFCYVPGTTSCHNSTAGTLLPTTSALCHSPCPMLACLTDEAIARSLSPSAPILDCNPPPSSRP